MLELYYKCRTTLVKLFLGRVVGCYKNSYINLKMEKVNKYKQ